MLKAWLSKFPKARKEQIETSIRSAKSIQAALDLLRKIGYRGSYDSVQHWINTDRTSATQGNRVAQTMSDIGNDVEDPIGRALHLATALSQLCEKIVTLLTAHDWLLEDGQTRLNNRDAMKLLSTVPGLIRASSGTILEMSVQKARLQDKEISLGILQELESDWEKTLSGDNPELTPLLQNVSAVTKSRLELDRSSLLERFLDENSTKVSAT